MNMQKMPLSFGETGYFFVVTSVLLGVVMLVAAVSAGVVLYGILQFLSP
jgi:hypothetical protein